MTQKNPFIFIFKDISYKNFRYLSSLLCLLGDIFLCLFLYLYFTSEKFLNVFLEQLSNTNVIDHDTLAMMQMGPTFHMELHQLIIQSLILLFVLAIGFNLIHYGFFILKNSSWARKYIKFMTIVGVPSFIFIGLTHLDFGIISIVMIAQSFLYTFTWYGLNYYQVNLGTEK